VFDVPRGLFGHWVGDGEADFILDDYMGWGDVVKTLFDSAAAGGSVEIMQWLRDTYNMQPTPITMEIAAAYGRLRALRWLHEAGAPSNAAALGVATVLFVDPAAEATWRWYDKPVTALCSDQLDWLQACAGVEWSAHQLQLLMHAALQRQDGGLLRWLRACDVPWPANAVTLAASENIVCDAEAGLWALQQGCPFGADWTSQDCQRHSGGRRSVLRRLHEMGAPCTCPRG
jgi:hypothetical protein